ncbi:hypothetical protein LCGC14_2981000 [marine sediment metagenome]|uniref:Uncharacterized protein n=1 Tax=marine sediment metagenome TaxID=412755 RepID=A0A0F8XU41_9ZZZZ
MLAKSCLSCYEMGSINYYLEKTDIEKLSYEDHDSLEVIEIVYKFCVTVSCLINGKMITFSHYSISIDNSDYCFHGHSHSKKPQKGLQRDVSVDNSNFCPLSYRKLTEIMKKR